LNSSSKNLSGDTSRPAPAAVRLVSINKRFGAVQANKDVNLTVPAGTVHGLVGENGAGKSVLMSILYGFYTADSGSIEINGRSVRIRRSDDAIQLGIGMVHQHFMLVDTLSALDNVMLGIEPHWSLPKAEAQARTKLKALMEETGLHVELDARVRDLPVGDCQRLEILKTLYRGAQILILDEPTAVLTVQETEQLFEVLKRLRAQGKTILLITHKLKEVMALCDAVTVMRAGQVVHECTVKDTTIEQLAEAMVGRKIHAGVSPAAPVPVDAAVRLSAQHLSVRDMHNVQRLNDVSLHLRAGEIVGLAGVSGNGQTELLEILSGLRAPAAGELEVGGRRFDPKHWIDPQTAREAGVAHVPEDRHSRGLVMDFEAWESAVLGYEHQRRFSTPWLWMRTRNMLASAKDLMQRFDVRPLNLNLLSSKFSGGNQQKIILAREFEQDPKVLLVGQPTRGVDIGAIEFIHAQLRQLRNEGCAILVVSSELDEILTLSDRVLVMNQGRITGELLAKDCTERKLGMLMTADASTAKQSDKEAAIV
jgi:general nucleoside transport system ATP-binding protein